MEEEVFERSQRSIERVELRHNSNLPACNRRFRHDVAACDDDMARSGKRSRGADTDGGRFAGAVGSQQAKDPAGGYRQINSVDRNNTLPALVNFGQGLDRDNARW